MTELTAAVLIVIGTTMLVGMMLVWIAKDSSRVHRRIREIRQQASGAKTLVELQDAQMALRFRSKEFWHRSHSEHALEVLAYINGRMKGI